ncbi:MAG: hypothetical protein AVDCRST_MAG91-461, partial [uncultured Sphingomonadaceae bacterium]
AGVGLAAYGKGLLRRSRSSRFGRGRCVACRHTGRRAREEAM